MNAARPFDRVALSPRGATTAAALAALAALDARVRISAGNQDVLDASHVVCLAVVPQIADDGQRALEFDRRRHVVSFIAGMPVAKAAPRGQDSASGSASLASRRADSQTSLARFADVVRGRIAGFRRKTACVDERRRDLRCEYPF